MDSFERLGGTQLRDQNRKKIAVDMCEEKRLVSILGFGRFWQRLLYLRVSLVQFGQFSPTESRLTDHMTDHQI